MRQAVLGTAIEGHGIPEEESHRLAPAGNRCVNGRIGVGGECAHMLGDGVRGGVVVRLVGNVAERRSMLPGQDVDLIGAKDNARGGNAVFRTKLTESPVDGV